MQMPLRINAFHVLAALPPLTVARPKRFGAPHLGKFVEFVGVRPGSDPNGMIKRYSFHAIISGPD